jgi:hypothetical protein
MRNVLIYIIALAAFSSFLKAADYATLCKELPVGNLQHPYLLFNNEEKNGIHQYIETTVEGREIYENLQFTALKYMKMKSDQEPARVENDLNARYIGYNEYRSYINFFTEGAYALAFIYQMTGDEKYAQRAFYCIEKVCALENWVQGAHYFENIYSRIWPYGTDDDRVVFSFDITASTQTIQVSIIYDWLYPALKKAQRDRIRGALLEKAILRVRGGYEFFWWNTAYKCNWSAICHSGLGIASLAILPEAPQLVDVVARSCEGIDALLNHIGKDGGWQEGRGYLLFAISESTYFMDMIKRVSKGKIDLFMTPAIKNTCADFALFGLTGSFSDSGGGPVGSTFVYNKLISETKNPTAMWYKENYLNRSNDRRVGSVMNLIWRTPTGINAVKPKEASKHFKSVDWAFMRKDFGDQYLQIAAKAGENTDPHHGHLDVGTFNLTWKGETLIGEISSGGYDLFVFDECRWDYLHASSRGHNVVMVDGEQQAEAKHKDQPWATDFIGGKIEKFVSEPQYGYTIMDCSKAYPGKELNSWRRTLILDKDNNIAVILDKVGCAKGATIDVLFHPNPVFTINDGKEAYLNGESAQMIVKPLFNGDFTFERGRQLHYQVVKENDRKWEPYLHTVIKAPKEMNVIGTVVYPAEYAVDKKNVSVTMIENGKQTIISYRFENKKRDFEITDQEVKLK